MKKLILIVLILFLSQYQLVPREVEASSYNHQIKTSIENLDEMTYRVFIYEGYAGAPGGIYVINVTKEKLEIEKLNLEIQKFRNIIR